MEETVQALSDEGAVDGSLIIPPTVQAILVKPNSYQEHLISCGNRPFCTYGSQIDGVRILLTRFRALFNTSYLFLKTG
jgi:hypothetical protein